jgi:hypothetical protein
MPHLAIIITHSVHTLDLVVRTNTAYVQRLHTAAGICNGNALRFLWYLYPKCVVFSLVLVTEIRCVFCGICNGNALRFLWYL